MDPDRKSRRCAVYTRKSSEEGLEQEFNSLQAQREACEAFIKSQRGEGWQLIGTAYDDGGISGGTMERPGLQKLLTDIEAGKIDVVVVYKVDRLTRSLPDFARMVEVFDRKGVSFVAVTQQFNTTTSMGRLTLNVLLSFAQFEREVTGERIRDKIAASKKKGMWMGGTVPVGYAKNGRSLEVVPADAEKVRLIFNAYLQCTSVRQLATKLWGIGVHPGPQARNKQSRFYRGALYTLLSNPIYIGEIRHKDRCYPGLHEAIVNRDTWDQVQAKLAAGATRSGPVVRMTDPSPLMGKIVDEQGNRLTPSHAIKDGRRYRYYVSPLPEDPAAPHGNWRLPAEEIERRVLELVHDALMDGVAIATAASAALNDGDIATILNLVKQLKPGFELVERVQVSPGTMKLAMTIPHQPPLRIERVVQLQMKRRGVERKLVLQGPHQQAPKLDAALLDVVGRGIRYWSMLQTGQVASMQDLAKKTNLADSTIGRIVPLGLLAPDIVKAIMEGRQPPMLTAQTLLHHTELSLDWAEQRAQLGFA